MKLALFGIALIAAFVGFVVVPMWAECLDQHSVLFCMRVLGR